MSQLPHLYNEMLRYSFSVSLDLLIHVIIWVHGTPWGKAASTMAANEHLLLLLTATLRECHFHDLVMKYWDFFVSSRFYYFLGLCTLIKQGVMLERPRGKGRRAVSNKNK